MRCGCHSEDGAVLGSGTRETPLGRHHEQVTLYKICSLGMYRTQTRPADPCKHRNNAMRCVLVGEEGDGEEMRVCAHARI